MGRAVVSGALVWGWSALIVGLGLLSSPEHDDPLAPKLPETLSPLFQAHNPIRLV